MFSHPTEKILDALVKAYESAIANYEAASILAGNRLPQSTSLAILALEEVGKMMLIDGLLFARTGDERYVRYQKGHLKHRTKLDAVELYPLFLNYLTLVDPRREENPYKQTMLIIFTDLKEKRQRLVELFGNEFSFQDLDFWKQKEFYSHDDNGVVKSNKEAIDSQISAAILEFTWRVTNSLKFVVGQSLDSYKNQFVSFREKIDEQTLRKIRTEAGKIVDSVFGLDK